MLRIKMQHYSCDLAPVSTVRICVEQAEICDDVLFVIDGQYGIGGCGIGDIGIKRAASAWALSQQIADDQFYVSLLGIVMTSTRSKMHLQSPLL